MDHGVWSKNWRCQYSDWKVQTHPIVHAKKLFFYGNKPPHNRWDILRSQGPVRQKFLELTLIKYRKTLLIYVCSIGRSWGSPINNKPAVVIGISLNCCNKLLGLFFLFSMHVLCVIYLCWLLPHLQILVNWVEVEVGVYDLLYWQSLDFIFKWVMLWHLLHFFRLFKFLSNSW